MPCASAWQSGRRLAAPAMAAGSGCSRGALARRQPRIFGAAPHRYRQGASVASAETPPWWIPELARDAACPCIIGEWARGVWSWAVAAELGRGAVVGFGGGRGAVAKSSVDVFSAVLLAELPPDPEAQMRRAGLEFLKFAPIRDEGARGVSPRFDFLLDRANQLAELAISAPFRTWMPLSLPSLPARKWAEILRECDRGPPGAEQECQPVKAGLLRGRAIEKNVSPFGPGGARAPGVYFACADEGVSFDLGRAADGDADGEAHLSTDLERWVREAAEGPWPADRLEAGLCASVECPLCLARAWSAARAAERRRRAAAGRFAPKRKSRRHHLGAKRYTERGRPRAAGGAQRRSFFAGQTFVGVGRLLETDVEAVFEGRPRGSRGRTGRGVLVKCYWCGGPGRVAADCRSPGNLPRLWQL
ncbi:unnamed protein product [Prorocentrum cordatum]|uniref:CCHC-type domain-containing protein n=1 Tax=Prorocentrum cordatum TaxID=2364126 RepID=A0ABN9TEU4_9DINO|nr:unnamed protein product [Polarella glacialis]